MRAALDRSASARRLVVLVIGVLALAGCQLDVVAEVDVEADGSGTIVVVAEADADLLQRVPTIADDLILDDVRDAGWDVVGPDPTPDGGLIITLAHDFADRNEATNLLRSIGPPFDDPSIGRRQEGDAATNTVSADLGLPDGFAAFADDDLVAAVGGIPFADEFSQTESDPQSSMTAELIVTLPGDLVESETNAEVLDDGRLRWDIPLDGTTVIEASAQSEQAPSVGAAWARPVSIVALVGFWAWIGFMSIFIGYVALTRWRRSRRYRRRSLPLADRRR